MTRPALTAAVAMAALAAASAAQAQRPSPAVGQVGVAYTRAGTEVANTDLNTDFVALEGALRFGAEHIGGSIDGGVTQSQLQPGDEVTAYAGTLHLNARLDEGLFGAFAGVDNSDTVSVWGAGLEGQANLGDSLILYGQFGLGRTDDLTGLNSKLSAARIDLRYFVTEDLKLQLSGGYQHTKDRFFRTSAWIGGVEGEYLIPNTPFSIVAGYSRYEIDKTDTISNIFRIGGRYTFGAPTLRERDQSGASLGTVNRLFNLDLVRN